MTGKFRETGNSQLLHYTSFLLAGQFVRGEQQKTDLLDWLKCLAVTFSTKDYGSWSHCNTSALIDMATVWTLSAMWVPKYRNKDISKNFKNVFTQPVPAFWTRCHRILILGSNVKNYKLFRLVCYPQVTIKNA